MLHLLDAWPTISQQLREAHRILLLFDYDGTLTPIVDRPDLASLSPETRELLGTLNSQERFRIGVISGRSLEDVSAMVSVEGLIYGGNHGLEIRGPHLEFVHSEAARLATTLRLINQQLLKSLGQIPGVLVENKGLSLSVHYRLTPSTDLDRVEEGITCVVEPFQPSGALRISQGKKVTEIRPDVAWNKGNAVSKLQETYPEASLPLFFGDDLTDEDAFAVVQDTGGIAVFVGPPGQPTLAQYRLPSPKEVAQTLKLMADI